MQLTDRLSPHFRAYEFAMHHGGGGERYLPTDPVLIANMERLFHDGAEPFRVAWEHHIVVNNLGGSPRIELICGWRDPKANADVGGAEFSRHMTCEAIDACCDVDWAALRNGVGTLRDAERMQTFATFAERYVNHDPTNAFGGFGIYTEAHTGQLYWLHMDVRPRINGHVARWTGHHVGSEQ
jgi:hypothetical protein